MEEQDKVDLQIICDNYDLLKKIKCFEITIDSFLKILEASYKLKLLNKIDDKSNDVLRNKISEIKDIFNVLDIDFNLNSTKK